MRNLLREPAAGYSWAVVLIAGGALALALPSAHWPGTPQVVALCLASIAANALMVPMPAGGYQTFGPAVAAAGLALFGAPATALAMAIGVILGAGVPYRRSLQLTLFNAGQSALAVLAARAIAHLLFPKPADWTQPIFLGRIDTPFALAMLAAIVAFVFVSSTLVSWRITVDRRASFVSVLGANVPLEVVNTFVLFVLGVIVGLVVAGYLPLAALLLTIPVALISITLLAFASHRQVADELEVLYATSAEMSRNRSVNEIVQTVAAGVDRLVPADVALLWLRLPGEAEEHLASYRGPGGAEIARQLRPSGLASGALQSGRPVRIDDYEYDSRTLPQVESLFGRDAVLSALVVPIATRGEIWGAIGLIEATRAYFTDRHQRLVTTLAGQAGLAIRNAHLFEETRRQVERLAVLQDVGLQAGATLNPEDACRHLLTRAAQILDARYAFLALVDEPAREVVGQAGVGIDETELARLRARLDSENGPLAESVRALKERRLVASDDLVRTPSPCPWLRGLPDARTALTAPLIRDGRPIGALTVVRTDPRPFIEAEVTALDAIASQGAVTIENARQHYSIRSRLRQMEAMATVSRRVIGARSLGGVLSLIAESAKEILGVDRSALLAWDGHAAVGDMHVVGLSEPFVHAMTQHVRSSIGRAVVAASGPVVVADLAADPRMGPLRAAVAVEGLRAGAFFPLRSHDEFVGLLMLFRDRPGPYQGHDLQLVESFAEQAALAVKNAALLVQSERRRDEMALVNSIVGSVSASLDLAEVFRTAVAELGSATGAPYVSLYRVEGSRLRLAAQVGYQDLPGDLSLMSGIRGRVARSGRPEFVARALDESDEAPSGFDITTRAAVPILLDGDVTSVLAIEGNTARPVTPQMFEVMIALGQHLSVAVRNASLYEELRKAHDELQVLYEAARSVSGTLDLHTVLDSLVSVTCRAFGYDNGALLMVDGESGDLTVDASYGHRESIAGIRLPPGVGISGWVARTGTPLMVDDVLADSRYYRFDDRTRSELAVPLIAEGKVLGVFNIESARLAAFGPRDLHMLTTLASYAVIAIQNANLFEQARRLAVTDGLTELHNHRYLYEALERMLERARRDAQPLSLIMLELDNFKRFNDAYGHQSGDEVLRTIAMLLRRGSRPSDVVARYGGDEFMVVLPNANKTAALETAERLRRAVEAYPLVLGDDVIATVTLSVGVATYPNDGQTVDALVEAVDRAQYIAKRSGGNKVQVSHAV